MDINLKVNEFEKVFPRVQEMVKDIGEIVRESNLELIEACQMLNARAVTSYRKFMLIEEELKEDVPDYYNEEKEKIDIEINKLMYDCLLFLAELEEAKEVI